MSLLPRHTAPGAHGGVGAPSARGSHRRIVFGTDSALADYPRNAIVAKDLPPDEPYRPPWAHEFNGSEGDIDPDPFSLPRLTVRGAALRAAANSFTNSNSNSSLFHALCVMPIILPIMNHGINDH